MNELDVCLGVLLCVGFVGVYQEGKTRGRLQALEELQAEKISTINMEKLNEKMAKEEKRKGLFRSLLKTAIDNY